MASNIDDTKPLTGAGLALTADVRANFTAAKSEIEALQIGKSDLSSLASTTLDDTTNGFNLVYFPPKTGETGVTNYQYTYGDIRRYGSAVDGSTDDTTAVQSALDSANDRWPVYFPGGTCIVTAQLTTTNDAVHIKGDGIGISIIKWGSTSTTYGFSLTTNSDQDFMGISDLSLLTSKVGLGTAVLITRTGEASGGSVVNRISPRVSIRQLRVAGSTDAAVDGWLEGIVFEDVIHSTIDNYHFEGYTSAPTTAVFVSLYAIRTKGANNPTEITISNSWAFYCVTAVSISGTVEGVFIDKCNFVAVGRGVNWSSNTTDPQIFLNNSHINATLDCVLLDGIDQAVISDNLFYMRQDAQLNITGVTLNDCRYTQIHNNIFNNTNTTYDLNGVIFQGTTSWSMVENNTFQNGVSGIIFQSTTSNNRQRNNINVGLTGNLFTDNSVNNIKSPGDYSLAVKSSNQTVTTSTSPTVTWQTESVDEIGGFTLGTSSTNFVVPAGVDFVDIHAGVKWAVNSSGTRQILFKIGGTTVAGHAASTTTTGTDASANHFFSKNVPVSKNDIITIVAAQSSGGNLDLVASNQTFFKVIVSERHR